MSYQCTFVFLVVEVVAIILRHSEELTGIIVGQTEIRLCMFADDMTMFLYNLESVKVVMEIFEEFYRYAGLKLNKKKTEALALQSIDCTPNNLFGIKWKMKDENYAKYYKLMELKMSHN